MTTLSIQIATGTDDGQSGTGSGYSNAGGVIQLGGYFGTANGWYRADNVTIASGSTISSFTLTGNKNASAGTAADLIFNFVKEADPTYPTSGGDYDGRTLTTASVTGSYSGTGAFTSANCATPAQEIIDQGTWASGNAQIFYARDNGSNAHYGNFENRIALQAYDGGSNIPSLNWTYSSSIQAAVPSGTVSFTGVAVTVRKNAPVVVGTATFTGVPPTVPTAISAAVVPGTVTLASVTPDTRHAAAISIGAVTFTGVSPTSTHQAAVASGSFTLTGVALTSVHYAGVSVGAVALTGVAPGSTHRAAVEVGSAVFAGVAPGSRHSAAVSAGSVVFGFGVHVASIQDINFNGSTSGSAVVMFGASAGLFDANPVGDDLTGWQTAVTSLVTPFTATVSLIAGGFRITFNDTDFHPAITISFDGTNLGLTTITQTQIGGNYFPVSVRKQAGVSVGAVTLTGVLPATRHRAAVEVGSVVFAGATPTADVIVFVAGLEYTATGRLHYRADEHRFHFTAAAYPIHYTAPDEDTP